MRVVVIGVVSTEGVWRLNGHYVGLRESADSYPHATAQSAHGLPLLFKAINHLHNPLLGNSGSPVAGFVAQAYPGAGTVSSKAWGSFIVGH